MRAAASARDVLGLETLGPPDTVWFEGRVQALDFLIDDEAVVLWVASNVTDRIRTETQLSQALKREREALDLMWRRLESTQPRETESRQAGRCVWCSPVSFRRRGW